MSSNDIGNMNAQMEILKVSYEQLDSIHESLVVIAENHKKHAQLLRELAELIGIDSLEEKK